jgi:hypothetical protein
MMLYTFIRVEIVLFLSHLRATSRSNPFVLLSNKASTHITNMETPVFDNRFVMDFDDALELIKTFFSSRLSSFTLNEEYNLTNGYWGTTFSYNQVTVTIKGDRGYLDHKVIINRIPIALSEFELSIVNAKVASEKNIRFLLETIKRIVDIHIAA